MAESHEYYMDLALKQAEEAEASGNLPIGALIVKDGQIVAWAGSRALTDNDPTAHAEILVLREAGARLGSAHLSGCIMYDTFEPCPMCCGAIINAAIDTVVVGGRFTGADRSYSDYTLEKLIEMAGAGDRVRVVDGVLRERCNTLLTVEKRVALGGPRFR